MRGAAQQALRNERHTLNILELREYVDGTAGLWAGGANVALQLGNPAVGRGVIERPLPGRNVLEAPFRRARSTFTYLAVALLGDDRDRRAVQAAVNRSHAHVRSGRDSPMPYDAFDPELQLWVAACLYVGWVDVLTRMHGPLSDVETDGLYAEAVHLATTLQVPPERWPATRADFDAYWVAGLASCSYDEQVAAYLRDLLALQHLPWWLRRSPPGRLVTFTNRGFLPAQTRTQLGLTWTDRQERRFTATMRRLGSVYRHLPVILRNFPLNACLWDVRRRTRAGRPPW